MLAALLNSAFTICFFHNSIRVFAQRTIKERCEHSCSNVGKILDAFNTNVCRKIVFCIFYKFLKKFSLDFLNPKKKKNQAGLMKNYGRIELSLPAFFSIYIFVKCHRPHCFCYLVIIMLPDLYSSLLQHRGQNLNLSLK